MTIQPRPGCFLNDEELSVYFQLLRKKTHTQPACWRCKWWKEHDPPAWETVETFELHEELGLPVDNVDVELVQYDGECRKNPPVIACRDTAAEIEIDLLKGVWPDTTSGDWCGCFEAKTSHGAADTD